MWGGDSAGRHARMNCSSSPTSVRYRLTIGPADHVITPAFWGMVIGRWSRVWHLRLTGKRILRLRSGVARLGAGWSGFAIVGGLCIHSGAARPAWS